MDFLWECLVIWFKAGVGGLFVGLTLAISGILALLIIGKLGE